MRPEIYQHMQDCRDFLLMYLQMEPNIRECSRVLGVSRYTLNTIIDDFTLEKRVDVKEWLHLYLTIPRYVDTNEV